MASKVATLLLLAGSIALSGCGSMVGSQLQSPYPANEPPPPPPLPELTPVEQPTHRPRPEVLSLDQVASDPVFLDPILGSPWARTSEMEERVQRWIESFQGREAPLLRETLARMGRYDDMVIEELRAAGLPGSLVFLPIVESWYKPSALSPVGAGGLWQFMPPTARGMGLTVDRLIDERRDPYKATPLALAYLADMYRQFDSWFLALAAYNGGPGRLDRILSRYGQVEKGHDGVFLKILDRLPRETRHFVPRFLAAARIGMNPGAYGFGDVTAEGPLRFEEITVPDATSLDVVARASEVDHAVLEELNPKLLRGLTPAGVETALNVPVGAGDRFSAAFARIPPEERVTFLEHSVAQGETLTHIARLYRVPVADLQATNPTIKPRRMQIGQRVVVPKAPSVGGSVVSAGERLVVYHVQAGDTLSAIAARHRVGVNDLLRWNSISRTTVIRPGDEVRIFISGGSWG